MLSRPIYYECHVTLEPVETEEQQYILDEWCEAYEFKIAELFKDSKRKDKHVLDSFCSTRGKDYEETKHRMNNFVDELVRRGFKVFRKKIEAVVYDERLNIF